MTIEETIQDLQDFKVNLKPEIAKTLNVLVANNLAADIEKRVLTGTAADGGSFTPYSTTPIYVNTSTDSPKKLPPKGKTGQTKFKNGKEHKTTYFEGGYRQFRGAIGRSQKKNFELSGEMWRGFGVTNFGETQEGASATLGGRTQESKDRLSGNSERERKNIINASSDEIKDLENSLDQELQLLIERLL